MSISPTRWRAIFFLVLTLCIADPIVQHIGNPAWGRITVGILIAGIVGWVLGWYLTQWGMSVFRHRSMYGVMGVFLLIPALMITSDYLFRVSLAGTSTAMFITATVLRASMPTGKPFIPRGVREWIYLFGIVLVCVGAIGVLMHIGRR